MTLSNETVQKILSDNNLSSPNRSQTENHIGEVITFSPGTLTTDDGVEITSVKVLDGDTVVDESTGQSYRIYGVDTNETAKWKSEAEDYANYQKDVTFAILQYAAATGKEITMVRQRDDGYERWVTDIQIDGTSLSGILAENGIAPVSGGAESNPTPNGFISKRDLQDKENRAQSNYNGIWSQEYIRHPLKYKTTDGTSVTRGETDPALGSKVKAMRIANETDPKTNSNALRGQEKIYKEGITKIGDVYLDIPPTQINISQLRNSYSVPQIGGESRPIFNSSARTVVKISNVFSGSSQINNDLKRILCQFIYNPINLVYSEDIYNKVIGDNKYIREAYNADEKQWWVPMTMDEIVLYTLEGHPDCVCANIQMSVFNFAAYFNSDPNVRIEYHKCIDYDSSKEVENNPQINENTYTLHLEEAIHPYNIRVEQKLNQENRRFTPGDSTTTIFKIAGTASSLSVSTKEKEGEELELKKANKKEGLDYLDDSIIRIVNSEVEGLTTGVQVHMKNNWAWMPVIGYSQPVAQYIGPGETSVSLNIKTNQKEMISKLLSTFGDVQNDNGVEIFYDDRYIVSNSLTRLVGSEICSMNNFSASNVNGHPGWSDINITFTKSTYATSETEDEEPNPLAAFDEYWGLQRILAPIGNKVIEEAIYRETNRLRKYMKDISKENNAIGALCSESGFDDVVRYLDPRSIVAYNKCLQVIRNHASTFSVPSDESVSFNVLMTNTIGLSYFKGITGQYEKKNIKLNGLDIFDRMSIARMPKEFANNAQSSEAIAAYAYYTSNSLKVGEEEKNFDGSLEEETLAGYLLRDRLIRVYCNSKSVKGLNGNRTSFVNLNTELWNEMKKIQEGSKDSPYVNLKIYSTRAKTVTFDFPGSKYDKYKTLIINSIKNAMDDAQGTLEVYNKNWSKLALAKSRGYSIDIGFIGTRAEAKLIQLAFSLGSTGEAFKWIRGRAVSFLKENQDEYPNIFVANCYTDSDNDNVMILDPKTKEIHVTEENYDERLKWVFKLTHAPSQALEMFDEDDVKETVQAIKTEDSVADPTARYILPYAAHRYYPKTDYFIKHHQVLSASVGDWFVNEYIGNPDKLLDMIENSVEDAISPLLNKEAWLYPSANQAKLNKNIVRKISEDENDPSKVIEGICLPFFSKDFSDIDKKGALKREKEGAINTAISVISKGIYFDDDGEAIEELPSDIPLDTFATASMCSEGYYDKIKDVGGYVKRYRNNLYNIYSQNINTSGKTAFLYDYANALQGKQVGGYVKLASNVASNSIIGDFDGSFVNSNIDVQRKLGGSYPANCLMFAMQKSPLLFMEQVGRYAEDVSVIGNSLGFNEVEADLKLKAKILRVLIQENAKGIIRNPSTSGESLKYYKKTEKWEHMNGLTTEMKDTLNKLREEIGLPFNINCGYATNGHSPESYHYKGMAVDFYIKETGFADAYKRVAGALSALGIADKVGLGVYPDWNHPGFHLDVRGRHARWGRIGSTYTSLENALAHYDRKQNTGQSSYELESKASSIVTDLKARLSPYKYAYYVNDQDIREYINRTNYVMRDRESLSWLQSRIAKRIQAYYPARLRNVDNQTKEMAARNSLISMPVTVGVENAFPTYKMYIIEEDTSDIRYFSLDDYYDVRTLQDVMVVRSKDNPVHTLKARVIIDPKYISVSSSVKQKVGPRNEDLEGENAVPATPDVDTDRENFFNKGLAPFRTGMRICLKLGYHSDPRILSTVFIGVITGLQGNMNTGVYEVEAKGDGRELTVPPSPALRPNVSGKNFAEIISILMRTNPSVLHFGKVYGSFLEKFSRRHFALLAMVKQGLLDNAMKTSSFLGIGAAVGFSAGYLLPGRVLSRSAVMKILGAAGGGLVGVTTSLYMTSGGMYNRSSLPFSARNRYEKYAEFASKIDKFDGAKPFIFTKRFISARWNNLCKWMMGNTFNVAKASKQVAEIMYLTYKQGNDPIDDNIFAVDIWNTASIEDTFNMPINSSRSIWEIMSDIKKLYPNFALDVRPYGSRSTVFMGPTEFNYWRTDDPLEAMAPQLQQISNKNFFNDSNSYGAAVKDKIQNLVKEDLYGDRIVDGKNTGSFIPFVKHHVALSSSDIIMNGIRSTPFRGWNNVVVSYSKKPEDNANPPVVMQSANANLDTKAIRTKYASITWTDDEKMANQYALGLLKEGVEKMYGGTLVVRGNDKIEPYDKIYVCDTVNKMFGWVEVETVIHKFDCKTGFTTHIVPNMVCSINNDAYSTFSQVARRNIMNNLGKILVHGGVALGSLAAGSAVGSAMTALGVTAGATAGAVLGAALAVLSIGYVAYSSYQSVKQQLADIEFKAEEEDKIKAEKKAASEVLTDLMLVNIMSKTYVYGLAAKELLGLIGTKNLAHAVAHPFDTVENITYKAAEKSAEKFRLGAAYISELKGKLSTKIDDRNFRRLRDIMDDQAKKVGRTIDWDEIADEFSKGPEAGKARLMSEFNETVMKSDSLPDSAKSKWSKIIGKTAIKEADDIAGDVAKKSIKSSITESAAAAMKKINLKKAGSFLLAFLAAGAEMVPAVFESMVVNAMLKSNAIICHPVYSKYAMLMTGLEGYSNSPSYMYIKDMIVSAQGALSKAAEAIEDMSYVFRIGDDLSGIEQAFSKAIPGVLK